MLKLTQGLIFLAVQHRLLMVLGSLVIVVAAGWGAQYLQPNTDYKTFFEDNNPQLMAFNKLNNAYTKTDSVFFVIESSQGDVFNLNDVALLSELTHLGWELPYSTRVDSIVNFQYSRAEGDSLMVSELIERTDLSSQQLSEIKQVALSESQLVKKLISEDGAVAGVNVIISLPSEPKGVLHEIGEAARALHKEMSEKYPHSKIHLSGIVEYNYASETLVEEELKHLVPLMLLVVLVILAVILRSFWGMVATLLVIVFSIATAMGIMGWLGWPLTSAAAGAPTIVLTMAVADCVHILVTYFTFLREGQKKAQAMLSSLRLNFQPVFLTSLTTAIGFLTMNFSDLPPFHVLGNVVAIGVVAAFVFAISFLPGFMMLVPAKVSEKAVEQVHALDPFANFVIRNRKSLYWGMSALMLVIMFFISHNQINDNFLRFISKDHPTRQATDFAGEHLSSFYSIEYSLQSPYEGGIYNPQYLKQVDGFVEWLRQRPEVSQVMTITEVFKRLNRNMHGDDPQWYVLPDDQQLSAQYLLLYEMSLPFGLDLGNQITFDKNASRVIVNMEEQTTSSMLALEKEYATYLRQNLPDIPFYAASTTLMFSHAGVTNAIGMLKGTALALLLISVILVVALRSIKMGIISIVPNLVPAALAFGVWGLLVSDVGISIATAIGMTLGIVVDNTVHFLSKYVRVRREQKVDTEEAVRYSFSHVGVALLATNVILIAGFMVLAQSDFMLNAQMGQFTALTFVMALIVDFLFLPTLLLRFDNKSIKA